MEIRSNFKDYYDHLMIYGQDDLIRYNRFSTSERIERGHKLYSTLPFIPTHWKNQQVTKYFSNGYIAFCGYAYPFYRVTIPQPGMTKDKTVFIYTYERLMQEIDIDLVLKECGSRYIKYRLYKSIFNLSPVPIEAFLQFRSPVFSFEPKTIGNEEGIITINPKLIDYVFSLVKTDMQCWTEISQFISNELNKDTEPTQVGDDKVLCITKGFDPVTSFRTAAPGERKLRRKDNKKRKNNKG